jgi:DinB superfamily
MDQKLPCLGILEATPGILRGMMCEVSEEDVRWKPAADRFSLGEVLAHLSHAEGHCYSARLDRFLNHEHPGLEPYDPQEHLEVYRAADPEDAFDHFEEQRETNLELLRGLPAAAAERRAVHPRVGEITLGHMLHEWALHDLGHIRQAAELVRARKYFEGAGPLRDWYQLKP